MKGRQGISLIDFLNGQPLPFYTAEMSLLHGNDFYEQDSNALAVFDPATIETIDWTNERVDIVAEYKGAGTGCRTIHQCLESVLQDSQSPLVFYDHGTGEIADFVSIAQHGDDEVRITLYHCKASDKKDAGRRVKDAYEVCGQAVKSIIWTTRRQLRDTIRRRFRSRAGRSRFLAGKGDVALADALLGDGARWKTVVEMVIVQPGIAKSALSPPIANLLAATNDYLIRGGCAPLRVLGSA